MRFSFLIFFYFSSALVLILSLLGLPFKYKKFSFFINLFTKNMLIVLKLFKINIEVVNSQLAVKNGYLYASKHQSIFETIYYNKLFHNPAYILKKELLSIPLFGTYLKKLEMIAIDRSQGIHSLKYVNDQALNLSKYRPIIIFPEGTRTEFKLQPDLKPGIYSMYKSLNIPVVPIALNSGKFWPKNNKMKKGKIIVEFREPIPTGLGKQEFLLKLKKEINFLNH
tara:strand:+ start:167 stop:838 length:672 start_codon:yes stop_codon:yes gene_type:complete